MATTAREQTTEAINDAANRRLAGEVWSRGKLDVCEEFVDPDWVLHQPSAADPGRGPAGYRAWVAERRASIPDFRLVTEEQFCLDDRVATRWTMRGAHLGESGGVALTGRALEWTGITIKRFANGKVAETRVCADTLAVLRQIGAVPGDAGPKGW